MPFHLLSDIRKGKVNGAEIVEIIFLSFTIGIFALALFK